MHRLVALYPVSLHGAVGIGAAAQRHRDVAFAVEAVRRRSAIVMRTLDAPPVCRGVAAAAGICRIGVNAHGVGSRYHRRYTRYVCHGDGYHGVGVNVAAVAALQVNSEGHWCLYLVDDKGDAAVQLRPLRRSAVLLVVLEAPTVEHTLVALVGHLGVAPGDYRAGARCDIRRYVHRRRLEFLHRVHIVVRRLALQHHVVVVHMHVAHLSQVAYRHAVAAVGLWRRRGAGGMPHEHVVGLRGRPRQRGTAVEACRVAVGGVEVGHRRRRRCGSDVEHEGGPAAVVRVLGRDEVAPRMAEDVAEGGARARRRHGARVGQVVGRPCRAHRRRHRQAAGVAHAYTVGALNGERRLHGYRQGACGIGAAAEEVAAVAALQRVGAGLVEHQAHLVGEAHEARVHARRRAYAPAVLRGAQQGQREQHGLAFAHRRLALDGEAVVYHRHLEAHQRRTHKAAAHHAVESYHTVAVGGVVPQHRGVRRALSVKYGAALHIPRVVVACWVEGCIGHRGVLAHCAVTVKLQNVAFQQFYFVSLLVVASAVVVHAVRDGTVLVDVLKHKVRRRRLVISVELPHITRNVAALRSGTVEELHRAALAHVYHLAAVGTRRVWRHRHRPHGGVVDEPDADRLDAGVALSVGHRHHHITPCVGAPFHRHLVAVGGVRHVAGHLPNIAARRRRPQVGMRRVGHRGALAGHHQVRVLVGDVVLVVVEALRVEVTGDDHGALPRRRCLRQQGADSQ